MKEVVIAIDIGGTSMKGAVIEENGNILYKDNFDVNPSHTTEEHKKIINLIIFVFVLKHHHYKQS